MTFKRVRMPQKRRSKYGAVKTTVDGIVFHSAKEARRYQELKLLVRAGEISDLALQPKYPICIEGEHGFEPAIAHYVADFQYYTREGELVVEDVKGVRTPVYRLKKKLVEAMHGIRITEI